MTEPGDNIGVAGPTYAMYYVYSDLFQTKLTEIQYSPKTLKLEWDQLNEFIDSKPVILFLPNPNQPIEDALSRDQIAAIAERTKNNNTLLVVDEAFQRMVSKRGSHPRTTWATRKELAELLANHEITKRWSQEVIDDVVNHETYFNEEGRLDMKWASPTVSWKERKNDYLDLLPVLEFLACPTLFISSSQRKNTFSKASEISVKRNHFSFSVINDTGHNMYMERPDAVSKLISAFCLGEKPPEKV